MKLLEASHKFVIIQLVRNKQVKRSNNSWVHSSADQLPLLNFHWSFKTSAAASGCRTTSQSAMLSLLSSCSCISQRSISSETRAEHDFRTLNGLNDFRKRKITYYYKCQQCSEKKLKSQLYLSLFLLSVVSFCHQLFLRILCSMWKAVQYGINEYYLRCELTMRSTSIHSINKARCSRDIFTLKYSQKNLSLFCDDMGYKLRIGNNILE